MISSAKYFANYYNGKRLNTEFSSLVIFTKMSKSVSPNLYRSTKNPKHGNQTEPGEKRKMAQKKTLEDHDHGLDAVARGIDNGLGGRLRSPS